MSTCNYCEIEFDDDGTCEGCCCVSCAEAYEDEQVVNRLRARVTELEAENTRLRGEIDQRPPDRTQLIVDDLREIVERYGSGCVHFVLPNSGCIG